MKIECRKCNEFQQKQSELYENLISYIDALDEGIKVKEAIYHKRLKKCDDCDALVNGMCKYCGCFVLVRAIKNGLSCPYPGNSKW